LRVKEAEALRQQPAGKQEADERMCPMAAVMDNGKVVVSRSKEEKQQCGMQQPTNN
jgi:hypothetical protein